MTKFLIADEYDKEEIIDFLNYVFSQSRIPHDFKTLMPKSYADNAKNMGATHFIVRENGKLKAVAACRIINMIIEGTSLKLGLIGNVAVHPYSRGKGFMKRLLADIISNAKQDNIDMLLLSGQRQRYEYAGFENAGSQLHFTLTKENINHKLKDVDFGNISFSPIHSVPEYDIKEANQLYKMRPRYTIRDIDEYINIMHTCNSECNFIYKNNKMIGYSYNNFSELVLKDETDFAAVAKAIFTKNNLSEEDIPISIFEKDRAAFLATIAETCHIETSKMINVLNWEKVLSAYLNYKSKFIDLSDGELNLCIEGEPLSIYVKNGKPSIEKSSLSKNDCLSLTKLEAEQLFFDLNSLVLPRIELKNWCPLPFEFDAPDSY